MISNKKHLSIYFETILKTMRPVNAYKTQTLRVRIHTLASQCAFIGGNLSFTTVPMAKANNFRHILSFSMIDV